MRQHAKTKQRKMMFTLLKRWKIENLSRRWANRRRQAEKKKKTKRKTQLLVLCHCFLICCHMCVSVLTSHKMNCTRFWQGEHPSPLPSAKCIVRRNLGGTFAHGCQKHASNPHYSYSILPPPQQFMWLNYEWPRRHSSTQAHWAPSLHRRAPEIYFKVRCSKCCRFWCAYYKFICVAD